MNKRMARRLAAASALVAPGAMGVQVTAQAAPTILTPSPNSTVGGQSVTIFARYNAPRPVASAKVFLDNLLIATRNYQPAGLSGVVNLTWDSTAVIPGAHRITLKMYDRAGAVVAQETIPVSIVNGADSVDTVPPQIAILAPSGSKPVQGSFDIKVLATDNSGKDPYVSVFVDQQLRGVSNRQPYSFSINSAEYANGMHTVEAWAYDAASNKATASAVPLHVSNMGGATELNEDVNRLGARLAENGIEPVTLEPTLPAVETPPVAVPTQPVAAPRLVAMAPQPTALPPARPVETLTVTPVPTPAPVASAPKPAAPAPVEPVQAPEAPVAPAVPTTPRLVAALPNVDGRRAQTPKPALSPGSTVPLVHIPPVHEVKAVSPPAPEPTAAPEEEPSAPRAIEELPVEVAPVEAAPASGIQELPIEPVTLEAPVPEPTPAPALAPVAAVSATPRPASAPKVAPKPITPTRTMVAALPAQPKAAARPEPKPAAPVVAPKAPVEPAIEVETKETVVEAAAPIVLTMRGERVIEHAPAPKPLAPKSESPKPVMVARADAPKPASAVRPSAGNPAPVPARLTALPSPTAPAVRASRTATATRVAAAPAPARFTVDLRPEIIRELPADRVRDGRILHATRPGETTRHLARRYGVPVRRLLAENHLGRNHDLRIGRDVVIPAPFRVAFNNETVQFDVAPRIENGVTLAALRQIYEQAGGRLTWDPARREVRAMGAGANIIVRIGSNEALVNGHRVRLAAPAFIDEGRTFLPVAFISESLGLQAEYDLRSGAISLRSAHADADIRKPA